MTLDGSSAPSPLSFDPQDPQYPLVAVLGPTAAGKSALALAIAGHYRGEVVNFDSVQIYRYFDLGTAKLPPAQRRGIPHHAIDLAEPGKLFTAGDYARVARSILAEMRARGRLPVLVGGTGFYLRALLDGLFQGPSRNEALRRRLQVRAEAKPPGYLHHILARLDPASAQRIHPHDISKIIRAVEVCLLERKPLSVLWEEGRDRLQGYEVIRIGIDPPRQALYERIRLRTERMFAEGLVQEVRALLARGISSEAPAFGSLGYRQAVEHLAGRLTLPEAVEDTTKMTRRYAKRQMTWFRRDPAVTWFPGFGDDPIVVERVQAWLAPRLQSHHSPHRR